MFRNLNAEMARKGICVKDLADTLGVTPKTVNNKLNGKSEFTFSEVKKVASLFPNTTVEHLFESDKEISPVMKGA